MVRMMIMPVKYATHINGPGPITVPLSFLRERAFGRLTASKIESLNPILVYGTDWQRSTR
jgi:hypothetical protein